MGVLGADKSFYLLFTDSEYKFQDATCRESGFVLSQFTKSECETFIIVIDTCHSWAFFNNNIGLPKSLVALAVGDESQTATLVMRQIWQGNEGINFLVMLYNLFMSQLFLLPH